MQLAYGMSSMIRWSTSWRQSSPAEALQGWKTKAQEQLSGSSKLDTHSRNSRLTAWGWADRTPAHLLTVRWHWHRRQMRMVGPPFAAVRFICVQQMQIWLHWRLGETLRSISINYTASWSALWQRLSIERITNIHYAVLDVLSLLVSFLCSPTLRHRLCHLVRSDCNRDWLTSFRTGFGGQTTILLATHALRG